MFTIILSNNAGELDRCTAADGRAAADALIALIEKMGEVAHEDTFKIIDEDEED